MTWPVVLSYDHGSVIFREDIVGRTLEEAWTIRSRTEEYLREAYALDVFRHKRITPNEIQAEIDRMAKETRSPSVLRELWAALDSDPYVVAECLARPLLVDWLAHQINGFDRW